jgi:16S rRNA (adenine1518-N6/adenine1519-N6)-dimethyltransferase
MYAKKSLGQHFLTSQRAVTRIIESAKLTKKDTVLEIGPGTGVLTKALCLHAGKVVAIEKDGALVTQLNETFKKELESGVLTIIHGDILKIILSELALVSLQFKVIANIPYYITGSILRHILSGNTQPNLCVLLVQKEVAERIARDTKESILSLSVKVYGTPKYIETVKAGSFSPPPKVDSAILAIEHISRDFFAGISEDLFFEILKNGFKSKRKFLINNLSAFGTKKTLEQAFESARVSFKSRAEDVLLEQWEALARTISKNQA